MAWTAANPAVIGNATKKTDYDKLWDNAKYLYDLGVNPKGHIFGLGISNAADTEHDITIAVGTCRDSTNVYDLILAAAITKQIDAAWAAGTNAGGLFSGAVGANAFYYIFLIRKDSDGSIDAGFDTSVTAANIPAGYTAYRRIGALRSSAGSNILNGTYTGGLFTYYGFIVDRAYAGLASTDRILITVTVPPNFIGSFSFVMATSTGTGYGNIGPTTDADNTPNSTDAAHHTNTTSPSSFKSDIKVDASSQIYIRASTSSYYIGIKALGWIDDRGKIN